MKNDLRDSADTEAQLAAVSQAYPVLVSGFLQRRIAEGTFPQRAARQYLPSVLELADDPSLKFDPYNEGDFRVEGGSVIARYANRAALIITQRCLSYCRFCFRRDFVGFDANAVPDVNIARAVEWLRTSPEVHDVLVTGGDPLALPNSRLLPILEDLTAIPHVRTVRIHTRALALAPSRINQDFLGFLARQKKIWFFTHMNHLADLQHPEVLTAVRAVQDTGTPILNQCVVLGGVNDTVAEIEQLLLACYEHRIAPYHLYALDRVKGAGHFQVNVERLLEIFQSISDLPGPAQPVFVVTDLSARKRRFVYDEASGLEPLRAVLSSVYGQADAG